MTVSPDWPQKQNNTGSCHKKWNSNTFQDDIHGRAHLDLATIALAVWVGTSDGWACRFSADIRGPLRMIPNNFSDLLTSPLAPT